MPKISIIVRTKNEERWIGRCLRMIYQQDFKDLEVVLVDNRSSDHTVAVARKYPVKVVEIGRYLPGDALNAGIRASSGEFIACLSAHCIPQRTDWLSKLHANMERADVAGVYGRQLPMAYSTPHDKRDLLNTFGLDHRIQVKDTFFHNANSLIRRSVWDKIPFDAAATNIEDRIWGKAVIEQGWKLAYEPAAAVYHYHGIHQDGDPERARNVVRILESLGHGETVADSPPTRWTCWPSFRCWGRFPISRATTCSSAACATCWTPARRSTSPSSPTIRPRSPPRAASAPRRSSGRRSFCRWMSASSARCSSRWPPARPASAISTGSSTRTRSFRSARAASSRTCARASRSPAPTASCRACATTRRIGARPTRASCAPTRES
ncbi:MAG: glycosyltransferase [Elusimicrobiota bacterium]|nr:MAG: glycosyltransferase [Elusimicrobiota bacterium]